MATSKGLLIEQRRSVQKLYDWLLETGWQPDQIEVWLNYSIICHDEGPYFLFHQPREDERIRGLFSRLRKLLPPEYLIQNLSLDCVGALATANFEAFVAFTDRAAEDFIALSTGLGKLRYWAIVLANAGGTDIFSRSLTDGPAKGEVLTQTWWRESILPVAGDILGCMCDFTRVAKVVAWDLVAGDLGGQDSAMRALLESFVVFHEIAHYELQHGNRAREIAATGRPPSIEENHLMEWEADQFAWKHLLRFTNLHHASRTLAMLFALFAVHPRFLKTYPSCEDGPTYPHPLTRLVWLFRMIYPNDIGAQWKYVWYTLDCIQAVLTSLGDEDAEERYYRISACLSRKPDAPRG